MKLLIVDDQRSVVQGLANCTDWGAVGFDCVATAYNAIDARASLLEREAEVMLCDIEMPVESGLDLLKWMRDREMRTRCIFYAAGALWTSGGNGGARSAGGEGRARLAGAADPWSAF